MEIKESKDLELLEEIGAVWQQALEEFFRQVDLRPRQILVLGCSTSEVSGQRIGQHGSLAVAETLFLPLYEQVRQREAYLAVQGCEHINRALVIETECLERYSLEEVTVLPALKAGGAMSTTAWHKFQQPRMVEKIQAHAGIDIGDTFIGMHLRPVAVPVRISVRELGQAHLTLAKTRPRLIGGQRAMYP